MEEADVRIMEAGTTEETEAVIMEETVRESWRKRNGNHVGKRGGNQ